MYTAPSRGEKYVLNVGRHSPEKQSRLIAAFSQIAGFPDWTLVMAGSGPLTDKLKQQSKSLGLGARVVFPGHIGNIGDWYSGADIFA